MAQFESSLVSLRVMGDALAPEDVTKLLGCEPTEAWRKADQLVGPKSGVVRIASSGMWRLAASAREPEDLEGQISDILGALTHDLCSWAKIRETCDIELMIGLFMSSGNDGVALLPAQLLALGQRGIEIVLHVYDQSED